MNNLFKIQTVLLLLALAIGMLPSCTKENTAITESITDTSNETEVPAGYEFAKTITVEDSEGNMANVQIASNYKGEIDNYTQEDFVLKTSKEKVDLSSVVEIDVENTVETIAETETQTVDEL